jgi:hypothetical protein
MLEEPMRLYRVCTDPQHPDALDSFRSRYELGRAPRGLEVQAAVIHMAVSMFETAEPCRNLIRRTRRRIGTHVAELKLRPGQGICVAKTSGPLHWSVWATPDELRSAVQSYTER